MAITYPLTMPTSPIARVNISTASAVQVSRSSFSYASQIQRFSGQLWLGEVTLAPMQRESAEAWVSFLLKLNGREGTFNLLDPSKATPRGSVPGTPLVKGGGQTGNSLITDGWTAGQSNILRYGDLIQIGQRTYCVLDDVNSNGSGEATFDIWPRLRESPSDNASIITSNCTILSRLSSNSNSLYSVDNAMIYGISFSAEEAV